MTDLQMATELVRPFVKMGISEATKNNYYTFFLVELSQDELIEQYNNHVIKK